MDAVEAYAKYRKMAKLKVQAGMLMILVLAALLPEGQSWSKEGHMMTCRIAQDLLEPGPAHIVEKLLPENVHGDLSLLCTWPDQIRHWYQYRWTSPLHYIDTPDDACNYIHERDCHDQQGMKEMCVDGAIQNFTSQLLHYNQGSADRRYNMTEALLFLSHFMGDIHQPMHVGFTSDEGGNTIQVWDRDIILTTLKDYYDNDMDLLLKGIQKNITHGMWHDDLSSWRDCGDLESCPKKYASESISLACKWGYNNVKSGDTLSDEYLHSRMSVVMKRIAQGGVRLAMMLNRIFGEPEDHGIAGT